MKSTYIIYYEAYAENFKLVSNGNHEVTVINAGEGFLKEVHHRVFERVKTQRQDVVALVFKHICKL